MYSGTTIAWERLSSKTKNKVGPKDAEFIVLVGSENGSTRKFAQTLHAALLKSGNSVFTSEMNHYQEFPKAKHLIILRSEEHTSELQSRPHLVCRLLLEKKNI